MPKPISVTLLTKNSRKYLHANLTALQVFEEVVVLDNGSIDDTLEIARQYANTRIICSPFIGFGPLKNLAAEHATHSWILSVDSDEVVSGDLAREILALDLMDTSVVYSLLRHNYYGKKLIKACGWDNDVVPRLYHKASTRFADLPVHEYIQTGGMREQKLSGSLNHYSYDSISQLIQKMNHYTTLFAQENRFRKSSSPAKSYLKWAFSFFRNYILQRGFLYGYEGFAISFTNANSSFYKYIKLHEENQRLGITLVIIACHWKEGLAAALKSAFAQSELPQEILVAETGSGEDTRTLVEEMAKISPVPLQHSGPTHTGSCQAEVRNKAIHTASGEYVVMVGGDMVLHPDFLKHHRRMARKQQFIQGRSVLLNIEDSQRLLKATRQKNTPFPTNIRHGFNKLIPRVLDIFFSNPGEKLEAGRDVIMAFWRADALRVNGFNESPESQGREESAFATRLQNSGTQQKNLRFGSFAYHLHHHECAQTNSLAKEQLP